MLSDVKRSTVLLSKREGRTALARTLGSPRDPARCVESVGDLVRRQPLNSVAVLVLDPGSIPAGILLADVGRLHVEHPGVQKLALLDEDPPLEVVTYLTSCGVDILRRGADEEADGGERLAAVLDDLRERARWSAS